MRVLPDYGYFPNSPYLHDPDVGQIHRPNWRGTLRSPEFEVDWVTNSEGFRSRAEYLVGTESQPIIAVLGDSFVQGIEVEKGQTFVALLERYLAASPIPFGEIAQVQNYGVRGIGIAHYLKIYQKCVRPHRPNIAIISILPINDFRNSSPVLETEVYLRPQYLTDANGAIIDVSFGPDRDRQTAAEPSVEDRFASFLQRHSAIYRFILLLKGRRLQNQTAGVFHPDYYIFENPWQPDYADAWDKSRWALERLIQEIRADGAIPLVILSPHQRLVYDDRWGVIVEGYEERHQGSGRLERDRISILLQDVMAELAVPFFDLTEAFRREADGGTPLFWEKDGHLAAAGHRVLADALYEILAGLPPGP